MSIVTLRHAPLGLSSAKALVLAWLILSAGLLSAQLTVSAGPRSLAEVKTVYLAPVSDDFARVLRLRLEKWGAFRLTSRVEEADAILTCETKTRIVPATVFARQWDAQVRLMDSHSQKLIWSTKKSAGWESNLADAIVGQLEKDRAKSLPNN